MVQNIFRFQVPVNNVVFMNILQSLAYLFDYHFGMLFLHQLVTLQEIVQLPWNTQLKN